jgi:rubrerythrin|tara:strand:- start:4480 stop:4731 length:252 start_codon:yes stop_codon:yes gene_type:complete
MKIKNQKIKEIIREELIREFTTIGIDVPRIVSLRRPIKKRSKSKDPLKRIETDLHYTQDAVDRLEEFTREIYNMLIKIIRKNK